MGYNPSRRVLEENKELLEMILVLIEKGEEVRFKLEDAEDAGRWHYKVNRLLHSAKIFNQMYGGRYATIRDRVMVKLDVYNDPDVVIWPKTRTKTAEAPPIRRGVSENQLIEMVKSYTGILFAQLMHLEPGFSEERLKEKLLSHGYELMYIREDEIGGSWVTAERIEDSPPSPFENLRSKYTPIPSHLTRGHSTQGDPDPDDQ